MKRILFVDDEPLVLDGLRDLFRKQRREWDMVFAPGGPEGIEALGGAPFDVIVSDMRMPRADGNAVLQAARDRQPAAARVILSGYAGREAELAALTVAHQFVSKPCEPGVLRAIIERACALPALLASPRLRQIVGRLGRLPSPPKLYWDLTRATARHDVTMQELADLVEQDPAMTAKVLQLVNSAVYGSARHHASVHQALLYLGTQRLKALAVTAQVFLEGQASASGLDLEALQQHAADVAALAQQFVGDPARAEIVFTAALLHEIGKVVLAIGAPDEMEEVSRVCAATGALPHEAEQDILGTTHGDAGAYLLALWGLPLEIVEAAQHHHHPERAPTEVVVAVHAADALLHEARPTPPSSAGRLHLTFLEQTPWGAHLPRWRALAADARTH